MKALLAGAAALVLLLGAARARADFPAPPVDPAEKGTRTAVFAGGCFWGVEAVFERLKGVQEVVSGYSGGEAKTAHYEVVGTGRTGHAESVRVIYDASRVSYGTLLKVFFSVAHDPTQFNFQGPDYGTQYRSAIFYADAAQRRVAEEYIRSLDKGRVYGKKIVTQLSPLEAFYPAEDYHQDYLRQHPTQPYIMMWDLPKIAALEKEYPQLLEKR
ncbi:MAG: peptide-methionine (S)-S-oxide reductase [Spirochaetes bacterium RBG_16_67_19]|nr:MAG: peptide-methionine (S)-S-oxide reductase [Spirochaetes bacterium RBG_16_67_19]